MDSEIGPSVGEVGSMEDSSPSPPGSSSNDGSSAGGTLSTATTATASSTKSKSPKLCGVCGDRAKSYHFGGISCDSCKAFFRRSVQNDAHRNFHCSYDGQCDISITSRKCCQQCRFQKCLLIGMEKSWVMTEDERLQLLRQRMERKARQEASTSTTTSALTLTTMATTTIRDVTVHEQHQHEQTSRPTSEPGLHSVTLPWKERTHYLSETESAIIRDILDKYHSSLEQVPYDSDLSTTAEDRPVLDIISMLTTTIKRMTHFAGSLETFSSLLRSDQAMLLRCSMIEVCIIRAAYAYDPVRERWPDTAMPHYVRLPCLTVADLQKLVSPELHELHMKFNEDLRDIAQADETTYILLMLVVLFSTDRASTSADALQEPDRIAAFQDSYLALLRQHMNSRYGWSTTARLYPKLLLKLPDLRQVNDAHTQSHLQLSEDDVAAIQRQFGNILFRYRIEGESESACSTASCSTAATASPPSMSSLLSDDELQQFRRFYPAGHEKAESKEEPDTAPRTKRKKPP